MSFDLESPTQVGKSALLPYRDDQLYALVNDIESYPTFLDGCENAELISRGEQVVDARLYLNKSGFRQAFTTRNQLTPNQKVSMELLEGPFQSLTGEWNIQTLGEQGCKLSLDMSFVLEDSFMLRMAAPFFGKMGDRLVDAVVAEAARRFG